MRSRRPAWLRAFLALVLACGAALAVPGAARAQAHPHGVEVLALSASRRAGAMVLDYHLRVTLPHAVEEAALRGIPLHFVATATLWKPRWYWRDSRIASVRREWRLTYQPLTSTWRVSQGGLGQSHATLSEALAVMTRGTAWPIAEAAQAEVDGGHYVAFEWVLDTAQLPRPLQIGLTGAGGGDWTLGAKREVKLDAVAGMPPDANATPRPEAK